MRPAPKYHGGGELARGSEEVPPSVRLAHHFHVDRNFHFVPHHEPAALKHGIARRKRFPHPQMSTRLYAFSLNTRPLLLSEVGAVLFVFRADVLQYIAILYQHLGRLYSKRLGVRFGIVEGQLQIHMTENAGGTAPESGDPRFEGVPLHPASPGR
jgi:hypothetical protein